MITSGVLRLKLARRDRIEEDWLTLVDDDGMPFSLGSALKPYEGREVMLTIEDRATYNARGK